MRTVRVVFVIVVGLFALLSGLLLPACGRGSPSAPSPTPSAAPVPNRAPTPSPVTSTWNLALRFTAVNGSGCVAETMRSQFGTAQPYLLSITEAGASNVTVILRNASTGRACTFTPVVGDAGAFTTFGLRTGGYHCEPDEIAFRCDDGTLHTMITIGEDIAARVSGNEISGTWGAWWYQPPSDYVGIGTVAEFTGTRQ